MNSDIIATEAPALDLTIYPQNFRKGMNTPEEAAWELLGLSRPTTMTPCTEIVWDAIKAFREKGGDRLITALYLALEKRTIENLEGQQLCKWLQSDGQEWLPSLNHLYRLAPQPKGESSRQTLERVVRHYQREEQRTANLKILQQISRLSPQDDFNRNRQTQILTQTKAALARNPLVKKTTLANSWITSKQPWAYADKERTRLLTPKHLAELILKAQRQLDRVTP